MKTTSTASREIRCLTIVVGLAGCGSPDTGSNPEPESTTVSTPVLAGATNISEGLVPDSDFESETAAVAMGSQHFVAFNSRDLAHRSGDSTCENYSGIGASYNNNGTWRGLRIPNPGYAGVSVLNGDPAVTFRDGGTFWLVWVSSLAMSTSNFNGLGPVNGCVPSGAIAAAPRDRACLHSVIVPKDGSPALPYLAACFGSGSLDGGAVHAMPNGDLYAAYWNTGSNRIDVFKNFVAVTSPFTSNMIGHPFFAPHGQSPTLIAPDSSGTFWVARTSNGSSWTKVQITTAGDFVWSEKVHLATGSIEKGKYSADMYNAFGSDQLVLFYPKKRVNNITRLQGARCGFLGLGGTCTAPAAWITPADSNALFPAVAIANVSASDRRAAVSYWTDNASSDGRLTLMLGRIPSGTTSFNITPTGSSQIPCFSGGGYWGDYDAMTVHADFSTLPIYARYVTDSTSGTCGAGMPQHVSVFLWVP